MNYILYLFPFLISFFLSIIITVVLVFLSRKIPELKKGKKIARLGGLSIIFSFCIALLIDPNLYISQLLWGILAACFFILIIGLWDDFRDLSWKYQLFLQVSIAILVSILGVRIDYVVNPLGGTIFIGKMFFLSFLAVIFWVVLLINATNWLDGIDGLSGGVTLISALCVFFLSLKPEVDQPPVGIITMALAGSLLGFLVFNFHPARILAGTSGAMFMGFILAVLSIFAGAKIATAMLVMSIPILDAFWVIGERIKSGASIFQPDKRHLHYKLQELGWPAKKITYFFYLITAIIAIVALNTRAIGKLVAIFSVVAIMIFFFIYVNKKLSYGKIKA